MIKKEKALEHYIDTLCEGRDPEYKSFVKNMIMKMVEGDKWEKLSIVHELAEKLKKKDD
tara:strand:+ start:1057 stop:1233 length:177 start_codon:yes stop_codon:yes gene_type:complete